MESEETPLPHDEHEIAALITDANAAARRGEAARAVETLRQGIAVRPGAWPLHLALAEQLRDMGAYAEALAEFERTIALDPGVAQARSGAGRVLLRLGRRDEACAAFQEALQLRPTAARWVLLGTAEELRDRPAEAETCFRRALDLDPESYEAELGLALLLRDRSPDAALVRLRRARELAPGRGDIARELGITLIKTGNLAEADSALQAAAVLDPDDVWARLYRANALWGLGDLVSAEKEYRAAQALSPVDSSVHRCIGQFFAARGRLNEAEVALRAALAADPQDEIAAAALTAVLRARQAEATGGRSADQP